MFGYKSAKLSFTSSTAVTVRIAVCHPQCAERLAQAAQLVASMQGPVFFLATSFLGNQLAAVFHLQCVTPVTHHPLHTCVRPVLEPITS